MNVLSIALYENPRAASWRPNVDSATVVGVVLGIAVVELEDDVRPTLRYIVSDVDGDSAEQGLTLMAPVAVSLYVGAFR